MKKNIGKLGWIIILIVIMLIFMIPLLYMISMSFRTADNMYTASIFVKGMTVNNYVKVIEENPRLVYNFFSSVFITISTVGLVTVCSAMAVFGFSRKNVHGKVIIYNMLLCTLMVPISGLVIPLTQINSKLGLIDNYFGLILPYVALGIPFAITILQGFMVAIPKELEEAATVDGCGIIRLFIQIICPMLKPGIVVIVIWQFLTSWNEFFLALCTMTDKMKQTLPLVAQQYNGAYFSQPGALFAALTIVTIPTLIFYIIVQKQFVKGLTTGAVKG
ncbi:carbohydrate ABC transporter permease [Vallitalea sediminicola]